jgi:phage/plasmid primase-like uncharacterized protein
MDPNDRVLTGPDCTYHHIFFCLLKAKIRFEDENGAKTAWEKALEAGDGKVEVKGSAVEGRVLEGM